MQQELESEFQTALEHLVMLAKNRQGRSGVILDLAYQGDQTRFSNWSGQAPTNQSITSTKKGFSHD